MLLSGCAEQVLSKQPLWNALLNHFKEARCLVEGPLSNLKQSMVQLAKPKKVCSCTQPLGIACVHSREPVPYSYTHHRRSAHSSLCGQGEIPKPGK